MGICESFASDHCCDVQRDFNSQQEWIQPTAVVASSFYLCLEAQLTGEIAYAAFTQIVAILVLDYMTRPWNRVSMAVRSTSPDLHLPVATCGRLCWLINECRWLSSPARMHVHSCSEKLRVSLLCGVNKRVQQTF